MASSSSSSRGKHDVFLSFRGEDTRHSFVSHLYTALDQKGIQTFIDDKKLERGKEISPELRRAIQESRFSIVVLSENYASSRWCLDELVVILECCNKTTTVYPIFYYVDPSEVRKQTGRFGDGFAESVSKQGDLGMEEKVQTWRKALTQVSELSGWHYPSQTNVRSESVFIQEFVKELFKKLTHTDSSVFEDLVGMKSRMEKVEELLGLGMDEARVVGIWGMGGIGKTTITKAIYTRISCQFEGCSFIENVREVSKNSGLKPLREQLISQILMEKDLQVENEVSALTTIKNRVCRKKVLIVLDDVEESTKLENLIGNLHWFSFGSRIIITTRNQHMLNKYGITHIYAVEALRESEARELFKLKAFRKHQEMGGYRELVQSAVNYAKGVPLALEVLGSALCGQNKDVWESYLNILKESPPEPILQILKISLDGLTLKEKNIFLDIACFFKGKDKNDVTRILESCGFHPTFGIDVLVKRSLITISNNKLMMHDLIQELGWDIIHQESLEEPGKRSRLWRHEDMTHVLMKNTGTKKVEGIFVQYLDLRDQDLMDFEVNQLMLRPEAFAQMSNLRILKIRCMHLSKDLKCLSNNLRYLDWCGYPMKYMPSTFQPEHLVELHLTNSSIEQLWKGSMQLDKLWIMNLSHSKYLAKSPDFTRVPNLERLILEGCTSLVNLDPSIGILKKLICLNLKDCQNLKSLPNNICQLKALRSLNLSGCSKLDKLPQDMGGRDCLEELRADWTAIRQLPSSVGFLKKLKIFSLKGCKGRASNSWSSFFLPSIFQRQSKNCMTLELEALLGLQSLEKLYLNDCNLKSIPTTICLIYSLRDLYLSGNNFESLPARMNQLSNLYSLHLSGCKRLQELPELPSRIVYIIANDCTSLRTIISCPSIFGKNAAYSFMNCFKLEQNILIENNFSTICQSNSPNWCGFANISVPQVEIPKWFSHQSKGESSVSFELPPDWYNSRFLGIFFSVIGIKDKSNFCDVFDIDVSFKHLGTQMIVRECSNITLESFGRLDSRNMLLSYVNRERFPLQMKCYKEQLNEGGIEFQACLVGYHTMEKHDVEVEKFGVHLVYYKADEEAGCCIESSDLDRSVGVGVEVASASATTLKKRKRDDFNDNYYDAVAGPSVSGRFDDQDEDYLNSKRTQVKMAPLTSLW